MTPRQKQLYDFIRQHWDEHGYGPSYEVIALSMGMRSKSGVHRIVKAMVDGGLLERGFGKKRNVRVVELPLETGMLKAALREIAQTDRHQDAVRIARKTLGWAER